MSFDLKSELQIPDLWYDVYARILPGAAFAGAIRLYFLDDLSVPSVMEFVVFAAVGYLAALVTQPMSSLAVRAIERLVERLKTKERLYVRKVQRRFGSARSQEQSWPGEARVLGKMHGEVSFFIQLAILALVTFGATFRYPVVRGVRYGSLTLSFVGATLGFMVALRRIERAIDDEEICQPRQKTDSKEVV